MATESLKSRSINLNALTRRHKRLVEPTLGSLLAKRERDTEDPVVEPLAVGSSEQPVGLCNHL